VPRSPAWPTWPGRLAIATCGCWPRRTGSPAHRHCRQPRRERRHGRARPDQPGHRRLADDRAADRGQALSGMLEHRDGSRPATAEGTILAVPGGHWERARRRGRGRRRRPARSGPAVPAPTPDRGRPAVPASRTARATSRGHGSAHLRQASAPHRDRDHPPGRDGHHGPAARRPRCPGRPHQGSAPSHPRRHCRPACASPGTPPATPDSHTSCMHSGTTPPPDNVHHSRPDGAPAQQSAKRLNY